MRHSASQSIQFLRSPRLPRRLFLSVLLLGSATISLLASNSTFAAEKNAQPKLVLVLVVDGLPQEQVQRYRDQFGQGGFRRLLDQGAWYSNAHQAHGVTVTAVGHTAILTGAYPYQHGIINNNWVDPISLATVYCTQDSKHTYLGEETKSGDGTSPANLRVSTLGDELRYATGNRANVVSVAGKDRSAILLAGKTGTAYMYNSRSGNFASSSYYMSGYPDWHKKYHDKKPQDRFYGKQWQALLPEAAYSADANDDLIAPLSIASSQRLPVSFTSKSGKPDAEYFEKLFVSPFLDEMTFDFARSALDGEKLGNNPQHVTDLLAVSLSSHDAVNHVYGPESRMSHDHLQRLDRLLANFLNFVDQRVGLDNTLIVLTADHGFPNTPEFSQSNKLDAQRLDGVKLMEQLNLHLFDKFGVQKIARKWSPPNYFLDYALIEKNKLKREEVENTAARFLLNAPGVANTLTRTQLESGAVPDNRISKLMQRAWHRQISGDIVVVAKPYWYFSSSDHGASHGSPYKYDTNVPLMLMGKPWIKPGSHGEYAEAMDIAPSLAHILRIRPPAASEGRVLVESLR